MNTTWCMFICPQLFLKNHVCDLMQKTVKSLFLNFEHLLLCQKWNWHWVSLSIFIAFQWSDFQCQTNQELANCKLLIAENHETWKACGGSSLAWFSLFEWFKRKKEWLLLVSQIYKVWAVKMTIISKFPIRCNHCSQHRKCQETSAKDTFFFNFILNSKFKMGQNHTMMTSSEHRVRHCYSATPSWDPIRHSC